MKNFEVLDESLIIDGDKWYSVQATDEVSEWLFETFKEGTDFIFIRHFKGVWVDMPGKTLALLKLKWM